MRDGTIKLCICKVDLETSDTRKWDHPSKCHSFVLNYKIEDRFMFSNLSTFRP